MTRRCHRGGAAIRIASVVTISLLALLAASHAPAAARPGRGAELARWTATPRLPAVAEYTYSVAARVKLLLFWITRERVGRGRIVRAAGPDGGSGFELLIGSDPDRAPMGINRWGYIVETTQGGSGYLMGLMTESDEQTVKESTAAVEGRASRPFKAIRACIDGGEASAQVVRIAVAENFTFRDVDAVLQRLPEGGSPTAHLRVPAGTRPGFLGAVSDLIHASVEASRRNVQGGLAGRKDRPTRTFVYDRALYDLMMKRSRIAADVMAGSTICRGCIESQFEIRNRQTGNRTTFSVTYGTDGPLAHVPVRIVYQPRWWFQAELTLEEAR